MMNKVVDCPSCGKGERHLDGCPLADEIPAISDSFEIHPAGTRAELDVLRELVESLENRLQGATELWRIAQTELEAEQNEIARLNRALSRAEKRAAKAEQAAVNARALASDWLKDAETQIASQQTIIGELLHLLRAGSGDDSPEYARALTLVGVVPESDVSDTAWGGGLAPLDATKRAESAAHITQSEHD